MMLSNVLQFFPQRQIRIAGPRIGSNRDPDASRQNLSERIRRMAKVCVRSRAVDERHPLPVSSKKLNFVRRQVVAVDDERVMGGGEHFQVVQRALTRL